MKVDACENAMVSGSWELGITQDHLI